MESLRRRSSATMKAPPLRSDSTSTVESESLSFNAMKIQLFKTKMCRHFLNGRCKYSDNCTFSHNKSELTIRTDFAKTKLCKKGGCVDPACGYAHSVDELRVPTANLCPSMIHDGKCNDIECRFSHNTTYFDELAIARRGLSSPTASASGATSISTPTTILSEPIALDLVQKLIQMLSIAQQETMN
jgi:hypothetical protein